jgi:hypothetical protein
MGTDAESAGANDSWESPQDRLRRNVRENVGPLQDWVTLGGALADPGERSVGRQAVKDALDAAATADPDRLATAMARVLEAGLSIRDGGFLCSGPAHLAMYVQLRVGFGAELSHHVVCESCTLVFTPRRKLPVRKCDRCGSSRALPPFVRVEHSDGHGYSVGGHVAGSTHVRICACCSREFVAKTAATVYCGGACKKAGWEGRTRGVDLTGIGAQIDLFAAVESLAKSRLRDGGKTLRAARTNPATRPDGRAVVKDAMLTRSRRRTP